MNRMKHVLFIAAVASVAVAIGGCNAVGPAALGNGRAAYNNIVNQTEDEQILAAIVRLRYDQTFGLLAVTSITANISMRSSVDVEAEIGPGSSFEGSTIGAGVLYEENPTISYVPVRGEQFVERMLAPLSAEQTLLLSRMSTQDFEPLHLLVRRVNGLANPLFAPGDSNEGFNHFVELFRQLRQQGVLDLVGSQSGAQEVFIHDFNQRQAGDVVELLATLGINRSVQPGSDLRIALHFFVGAATRDAMEIETPTALETLRAASRGVAVPAEHVAVGIVRADTMAEHERSPLVVHASRERPLQASIATRYRDYWYFIDEGDVTSKQTFLLLRTLVGLRLDAGAKGQLAPILTVPVGR
ncbi:MAG: hypothetical protein GC183_15120 [Thiobacillus sp.]|nr:hypothetical protein [Thiobacillus sp.]